MSIPDQRKQGEAYCAARGYQFAETHVEPGASATNDRRPDFQKMMEAGTAKPCAFDVVIVRSFSRFFRDHYADTVRLAFRLALEGNGTSGCMGVKAIAKHLNERKLYTRTGGRWGVGAVHRMLTRPTYIGRHEFNKRGKTKALKPADQVIAVPVPPLVEQQTFDSVQAHLKSRNPKVSPPQVVKSGVADIGDEPLKEPIAELQALKAQAQVDAERASIALEGIGAEITPAKPRTFAVVARQRLQGPGGGYRRDHLRALAQRVEVADGEVRIMGSRSNLLWTLVAASGVQSATAGAPGFVPKWRMGCPPNGIDI